MLDNDSGDGTAEMVGAEFPDVRLLALDENLGFAAGVNRAAEEARGEYLLLLNPDTVVHDGALDSLVALRAGAPRARALRRPHARSRRDRQPGLVLGAAVALEPRLLRDDALDGVQGLARSSTPSRSAAGSATPSARSAIVTGCLLLAPRALWRELGGFDTRFFMYGEDADLALRAWARGLRPAITPDAVITHEIGVSSESRPDKLVLLFRGKATLLRKHWSPAAARARDRAAPARRRRRARCSARSGAVAAPSGRARAELGQGLRRRRRRRGAARGRGRARRAVATPMTGRRALACATRSSGRSS